MSSDEFLKSLTGFEEIAIKQRFGVPVLAMEDDLATFGRALVFVAEKRTGKNDHEAYQTAMSYTFAEVTSYFQTAPGEVAIDEDDPSTDLGKDA